MAIRYSAPTCLLQKLTIEFVAQKYKDYNKTRGIIAGKIPLPSKSESKPESKSKSKPQKRKSQSIPAETPVKKTKHIKTPSKPPQETEMMNSPAISRKLFSPAPVTSLGPTPQRDGKVLGLFDLLVEKELGTPSKSTESKSRSSMPASVQATPSKRRGSMSEESATKLGRTPMSSSKRQLLNTFMTPLKKRDNNAGSETPSSVSKLQFETPAFLKRHSLPALSEAAEVNAPPPPLRLPRKPLVRGLSEIVASLRKVEEEKLDDDLDALREMENEEMGIAPAPKPQALAPTQNKILEKDTQDGSLPLGGFDDEGLYDSPVEEELDRGAPLPFVKKKGQKRTTRLVNMKPTWSKRPNSTDNNQGVPDDDEFIPETQIQGSHGSTQQNAELSDSDDETRVKAQPTKTATKQGTAKKPARKVNELAHANFHRLKLRNYGAKGGPGFNSKFRRRR